MHNLQHLQHRKCKSQNVSRCAPHTKSLSTPDVDCYATWRWFHFRDPLGCAANRTVAFSKRDLGEVESQRYTSVVVKSYTLGTALSFFLFIFPFFFQNPTARATFFRHQLSSGFLGSRSCFPVFFVPSLPRKQNKKGGREPLIFRVPPGLRAIIQFGNEPSLVSFLLSSPFLRIAVWARRVSLLCLSA